MPGPKSRQKRITFDTVMQLGREMANVEVTSAWGAPALKVRGKMFACGATHKSAEPNTLVVMMEFDQRDRLIEEEPDTYYLEDHYVNYACVLVRLARVHPDALRDLLLTGFRFMSRNSSVQRRRSRPAKGSPLR